MLRLSSFPLKRLTPLDADDSGDESSKDWKQQKAAANKNKVAGVSADPEKDISTPVVDDIQASDVDSDMDPDEMVSTYLRTKLRLFDRNPGLVSVPIVKGNKKSKKLQVKPAATNVKPTPGEAKLQQRLKKIESDALFDQYTADLKWFEQVNELREEQLERKKLQVGEERKEAAAPSESTEGKPKENSTTDDIMAEAEAEAQKLLDEMGDDDDVNFAGMFGDAEEPDSGDNSTTNGSNANTTAATIRNFGKITGISPRRTFEEACRSRDTGAKVQYKMVSPTTYSARHSVTVNWTKDQEPIESSFTPDVTIQSNARKMIITMEKIACPDTTQSEGYISTAALFLLFSNSPKEEKSALRLPPAFRDLWQEFVESRREVRDAADREIVKSLRDIIRQKTEEEEDDDVILTAGFKNRQKGLSGISTPVDGERRDVKSGVEELQTLKDMWARKSSSPSYQYMLQGRQSLPMFQFKDIALDAVEKNQVVILCGETGCGEYSRSRRLSTYLVWLIVPRKINTNASFHTRT